MNKLNRKGFTLVELIAVIVLLSLIMGIGATAISGIIKKNKENDYKLLIDSIKKATESYYHECRYVTYECSDNGSVKLGDLISSGFLKGNDTLDDGSYTLVNPNTGGNIYNCSINWKYNNVEFEI